MVELSGFQDSSQGFQLVQAAWKNRQMNEVKKKNLENIKEMNWGWRKKIM